MAKLNFGDIATYRKSLGLNQSLFWKRLGVTQSGGSRYESGRGLPTPTAMLLWLVENGKIDEKDLASAMKAAKKAQGATE